MLNKFFCGSKAYTSEVGNSFIKISVYSPLFAPISQNKLFSFLISFLNKLISLFSD
jgi:hypothetical protein